MLLLRAPQVLVEPNPLLHTHRYTHGSQRPTDTRVPFQIPSEVARVSRQSPSLRPEPPRVLKALQAALTVRVLLSVALVVALHFHVLQKGLHLFLVLKVHQAGHGSRWPSQNHPAALTLPAPHVLPPPRSRERRGGGALEGRAAQVRVQP